MNASAAITPAPAVAHELATEHVTVAFGGVSALSDVSIGFAAGRGVDAIIGPNGAGKTTLFNVLTGVVKPRGGRVLIGGRDVTGLGPDQVFRRGVSRTFQGVRLFEHLTVAQNVSLAACAATGRQERARGRLSPGWGELGKGLARATHALDAVGLPAALRQRAPSELTLWHSRMVEIARALSSEPTVLLLDEPAAGLNATEKNRLRDLLVRLSSERNCHMVVVEHDMNFVMSCAERVCVLHFGRVLSSGTPAHVQADPLVHEAYLGSPRDAVS